jgi:hypothetical protein
MLAQYLDLTDEYNLNSEVKFETSNYDYAVIQIIGQSVGNIRFKTTINSGAIQNVTDGNILTSNNYTDAYATQLSDGAIVINANNGDGLYRFNVVGRYIKLEAAESVSKLLVMLTKIS